MANGRQRKRDVLLAKKAAEQAAKNGLAGLSPEGLTSIVSNDANDLDNVSYSTTDGATVNIKNNRAKDSSPVTSVLGGRKGYMPGNQAMEDELVISSTGPTTRNNLGGRKGYMPGNDTTTTDGPTTRNNLGGRKGYMPGSAGAQGPTARSSKGFNFDDELLISNGPNVRGSAQPQAKALTDFIGEDLSTTPNRFVTVALDSDDDLAMQQDSSIIGEELNDDGTVTYELPPSNMGNAEVTTTKLTEAQLEPGMYDGVEPGKETALTPTLDNKGMLEFPEEPIFGRQSDEEKATAAITMEEQLKEQALLRQLQADTVATDGRKGYTPGQDTLGVNDELDGARKGYMPGETQSGPVVRGPRKGYRPGNDNDGVDQDALYESPGYEGVQPGPEMEMDGYDEIAPTTPSTITSPNIHENEPGTTSPEVIAKEAENAEKDIQAAQAGNPHLDGIVGDAKTEVETLAKEVETGVTTPEAAADKIKNSLGQLGELLGIDGRDLIRGLFRYAGARVFGMSGNEAGRFMYEGLMADEAAEAKVEAAKLENMGLGSGATANQKNLKAYKEEIQRIDNDTSLSDEEKVAAKKTADEVFGINKSATMGRPLNIQGRRSDGSEEIVAARRNDNNSYDVFLADENGEERWVPIELSGLTDIQVTGRNANQAIEAGAKDMRNGEGGVPIPNAYMVGADGTPLFNMKAEQAKRYGLIKRAVDNYPVVAAMMANPEAQEEVTALMGGLQTWAAKNANAAITPAVIAEIADNTVPKIYASATSAWLQALLRADTGAAYTGTEIADYVGTNIPSVGDAGIPTEFKLNQMAKATKALIPGAGEAAPYLLGIMNGTIRPDNDALEGVEIAKRAIEAEYGNANTTGIPDGLSKEELAAFNAYP